MTTQRLTSDDIKTFKRDVVGACPSLVSLSEQRIVRDIPDEVFAPILDKIFGGDVILARNILYNRFDRIDFAAAEAEVENISTMPIASDRLCSAIKNADPILLISDVDSDGSMAQSLAMEMKRITNSDMSVQPRDYDPANHGFSIAQIDSWLTSKDMALDTSFTVLVSDLGTNQKDTQRDFIFKYPNAHLTIIDHHKPDADSMVVSNSDRTLLVSPFVKGSMLLALKNGGGVSGGYLTYVLFKQTINALRSQNVLDMDDVSFEKRTTPLKDMGKAANLLDSVSCAVTLKPLLEVDVKKALDLSSLINKGKSVGRWIGQGQVEKLAKLVDIIGAKGVDDFLVARNGVLEQNLMAMAVHAVLPKMIESLSSSDKSNEPNIYEEIAKFASTVSVESASERNYVELLRAYMCNFTYENQFSPKQKDIWLSLATQVFKEVGSSEKKMLELIREHNLVTEISDDFVVITQASSSIVSGIFTAKQISGAYNSMLKPVSFVVSRVDAGKIVLNYNTRDMSIFELKNGLEQAGYDNSMKIRGHDNVGGLVLTVSKNEAPEIMLKGFVTALNSVAKKIMDARVIDRAIAVKPIHLSILGEMLQKMRVHLDSSAAPNLIMKISSNMTFEDSYSLEKLPVHRLAEKKPWETTVEPLNFAMTSSLLIPNQALKVMVNDNYEGGLGITLMPNGSYIADRVYTGSQLFGVDIPKLYVPLEREQKAISEDYKKRFAPLDVPFVEVNREDAIKALKFTARPADVFNNTEAIILGVLNKTGADSYVVLDVEADGAGNAQCFNVGLCVYRPKVGSGTQLDTVAFHEMLKADASKVLNFRALSDGQFLVNEELSVGLVSQIINTDGVTPIRIAIKTQNLTNMDQDMIDSLGVSAEKAQERMMSVLKAAGNYVVQAHNLPYDENIVRVNFPEISESMSNAIHLDSAPLAKNLQIAYMNLQVNAIAGKEFFNAEHPGYNLSTLLDTTEIFDYPSIKGGHVLQVRGDEVYLMSLSDRITSKLKVDRKSLMMSLPATLSPMKMPKYGIQKLLRMATIHDMISHQPLKQIKKSPFNGFGVAKMNEDLWDHFQENYAYDMTPAQNVLKFMVIPDVMGMAKQDVRFKDVSEIDPQLMSAKIVGKGSNFDPTADFKGTKAELKLHNDGLLSVSNYDVLHANALEFVKDNAQNAERYSRAWVYDLVLEYHEVTRKDMPKSFITGVSEMTGISEEMVAAVYDDIYVYKNFRGIQAFMVHETHNNVGLEGDVFQEVNVFMHMLRNRLKNPFISGEMALKYSLNPVDPMVDSLRKQAAESTLRQSARVLLKDTLDDDVINSYSARQLDNFSDEGISIANSREGVAKVRCKTLSNSDTTVNIELPLYNASNFRALPKEDRMDVERNIELVVTAMILSNSRSQKSLTSEARSMIENTLEHPVLIEKMNRLQQDLMVMIPTSRDALMKSFLKGAYDAILGDEPLRFPTNKELTVDNIKAISVSLESVIKNLAEQQRFDSYVSFDEINGALLDSNDDFLAIEYVRTEGNKPDDISNCSRGTKAMMTSMMTARDLVLNSHADACPDLAYGVPNKKTDPLGFLLHSPLVSYLVHYDDKPVRMDLANEMSQFDKLKDDTVATIFSNLKFKM
jgi:hypothetical protein